MRFKEFTKPWTMVLLRDVAEYRRKRQSVSKHKYISTENMLQQYMGITPYTDFSNIEGIEYCVGDTLIGNIRPYLKKVWFASFNGACSADVLALKPNGVNPEFLYDIIAQDDFIEYVMSGVKGSKMPRGDKSHIMNYETAFPSLTEQEKIAYFLRLLSTRIQKLQLLIDSLKKYKRGLLLQELSQIKKIQYEPIGKHFYVQGGYAFQSELFTDMGVPIIRISNIEDYNSQDCVYYDSNIKIDEKFHIKHGDVLIAMSGATTGKTGKYLDNGIAYLNQRVGKFVKLQKNENAEYLYQLLNSPIFFKKLQNLLVTGAQPNISPSDIEKIELPFLCHAEIEKFTTLFGLLDKIIASHYEILQYSMKLKGGLLQTLFI